MKPTLGCCYYPEHWPESIWQDDADRMRDLGLSVVRIGEFAWSRLEPEPGKLEWAWLDRAFEVLGSAGLQIVLSTPTATPPRWMLERYADMLAVDVHGHPRKFGSRRHYCFSHTGYLQESVRIAELVAERYGESDYLYAWQTDNEYGCHDTVVSYSDSARLAFRYWLRDKYQSVAELNEVWGNVFWSMEYDDFEQIDLPNLTVTEPNPAHVLDFRRFCSDQVVVYNAAQCAAIRAHSSRPLIHNYMGRIIDFDHFRLGDDLEIASWDSYPLGFLEDRVGADEEWKQRFYRQGDPDFQAFHHDLYRAVGKGRWWIMEQQPGPVNWAPHNPAPLPGMVRLWTWEAIAHQAETVCYFRWRQAPFAQEQMHAGLLRPDSHESPVCAEVHKVADELDAIGEIEPGTARVAIVFDYESCWAWETQPQGEDFDYLSLALDLYGGLRRLGQSVDILSPDTDSFSGYELVLIPGLFTWSDALLNALQSAEGTVLVGPRSGSKTTGFSIPDVLPPAIPDLDCRVAFVESLRQGVSRELKQGGAVIKWLETVEGEFEIVEETVDGTPVLIRQNKIHYLSGWPDEQARKRILRSLCESVSLPILDLPEGVRVRETASHRFIFNHNAEAIDVDGETIAAADLRIQRIR